MKLLFTLLICFMVFNTVQAQNASLDAANRSVYNSISPVPRTTTNTSVTYTNRINIMVPTSKPVDVLDLFYNQEIFNNLLAPNVGVQNNPNLLLFQKSTINNLSYDTKLYQNFIKIK
jgi:hypothetical protein